MFVVYARHSGVDHSFICNYNNACLYLVSVHQMAPPQCVICQYSSLWMKMLVYIG